MKGKFRKLLIFATALAMVVSLLPAGALTVGAAPIADTDTTYTVNNILTASTLVFDGSGSSGYYDTRIEGVAKWSNWVSGWSGDNNQSETGNTNINLIAADGLDTVQFYGGASGSLTATDAYGTGKDFFVLQFYATAGAEYSFELIDGDSSAFATYTFNSSGILPAGASTAFGLNAWNRIFVKNVYDAEDSTMAKYMVTYATASSADGTYTEQYTATSSGSVNGFKGFNVTRTASGTWWTNVRMGNIQIYAGDFPASTEEAQVVVNYVSGADTIAANVASETKYVGSEYSYIAPEYYYDTATGSHYKLDAQRGAVSVVSGTNTYNVEYIHLGSFDFENAVNLVTNPSFENGMTDWTAADGNALTTYAQSVVQDSQVATDGEYYLRSTQSSWEYYGTAAAGSISRIFGVAEAGKTYYMSFDMMATAPNTTVANWVYMGAYTANAINVDFNYKTSAAVYDRTPVKAPFATKTANEWVTLSTVLTVGDTDGYLGFSANWLHDQGYTCFDNFKVYELEPATALVEINYYDSTDSTNIVRLSGTPAVTLEGYVSGAAGSAEAPVLTAYSITQPSPIVVNGVTYITDATQTNITSIASVSPAGGNVINLYYKQAPIVYAEWNAGAVKTRVGVTPTIPTDGVADFWTGDPDVDPADGAANLVSYDEQALAAAVASAGSKTITGTILGYSDTIEIPIVVMENLDYLVAHYEFKDATTPVKDSSGNGYDGTALNNGSEMSFDTENGFATFPGFPDADTLGAAITIPGEVASKMSGDWTYSVWANRDYTGDTVKQSSNMIVFDVATEGYKRYYFQFNSATGNRVIRDRDVASGSAGFVNATYDSPFPMKDKWSMMTVTFDSATSTLYEYVDGVLINSYAGQLGSPANYASGTFFIGRNQWQNGDNPDFKGQMSDIRIYDFALGAADIETLYQESALSVEIQKEVYVNGVLDATLSAGYANIGDTVEITPDATYTNATATYLYDAAAENVTTVTAGSAEALKVYYKTDYVIGAEAVTVTTREGLLPELPDTVTGTTTGGTVPNVPVVWTVPDASAFTVAASPVVVNGVINTGTEGGANVTVTATVTVVDKDDYLIADFSFDSDITDGGAAMAVATGSPAISTDKVYGTGALTLSNGNYLALSKSDGTNLLAGQTEITISYFAKMSAKSWTFFAEPNASGTTYLSENYVGILDYDAGSTSITAEKYYGGRNSADSKIAATSSNDVTQWHHTALTIKENGDVALYVDGVLVSSASGGATLATIMGAEPLVYLGYATWGSGEYATGLIDDFKIYSKALEASEIEELAAMPAQVAFDVNYIYEETTIATVPATMLEDNVYSVSAGKIYANGKIYSYSDFSQTVTTATTELAIPLTVEQAMAAATFATTTGDAIAWDGSTYVAAANNGSGAGLTSDADGNSTATGTVWQNYGSIRTATVTFNTITPTAGKAYVLHLPTYMVDVNTTAGTSGEMRITAGYDGKYIVSANALAGNGETRYSAYDPSTTEYIFDVTDAIQNGTLSFTLDTPVGGVGFPTLEMAAAGGLWAGCAPYITEEESVTLTGTGTSKLTVAGNEVVSGCAVWSGLSAIAYFTTEYADYTAEIEVNGELAATLDETSAASYALGELAADTAVVITVTEAAAGVTVSGTFTANADPAADVTVTLNVRGEETVVKTATVTEITDTDTGDVTGAAFEFADVAPGEYDLVITKSMYCKYVATVMVSATAVVVEAVALMAGDADASGTINMTDLTEYLGAFGSSNTDENWADNKKYDTDASGSVNMIDLTVILGNFGAAY
ncbi:MAG: LamG-like jellyroll fold domain-containing protein [Clostridia bacterium]|nr:LamG-like jellyroll fold domain-containing protein [Clostridia bacterium]